MLTINAASFSTGPSPVARVATRGPSAYWSILAFRLLDVNQTTHLPIPYYRSSESSYTAFKPQNLGNPLSTPRESVPPLSFTVATTCQLLFIAPT